jgi:poly(3-hydroxybutyrate) depolymerase
MLSIALLPIALLLMTISGIAQQDRTVTITSGGIQRSFILHLPSASPAGNLPLLLGYHGRGSSAEEMQYTSEFDALADQYNFITVYPQSLQIGGDIQWNVYVDDQPGHAGVPDPPAAPDDIRFTRDIIDYLASNFSIDRGRVYASGFSNGGFMCYALSMLASDAIRAIAPVAGNLWGDDKYVSQLVTSGTVKPIPVMHVHGTADDAVPYPDPDNTPKEYEEYPLFISSRDCNALTYSQVIPIMNGVDKLVFCPGPVEVSLVRIQGMGHAWTNGVYPTSREIVKFFGLDNGSVADVRQAREPQFSIAPNPASTSLRIELVERGMVQMVNSLGSIAYSAEHPAGPVTLPCNDLPAGIYSVRILPAKGGKVMTERVAVVH